MTELRPKSYLGLKISVWASHGEYPATLVRFCALLWTVDQFCAEFIFSIFFVFPLVFQLYMTELRPKSYLGLKISVWASHGEYPATLVRFCALLWTVDKFCAGTIFFNFFQKVIRFFHYDLWTNSFLQKPHWISKFCKLSSEYIPIIQLTARTRRPSKRNLMSTAIPAWTLRFSSAHRR